MRPYLVVIFHVRQQYMTEVSLAEHNNVVKALVPVGNLIRLASEAESRNVSIL